MIEIADAKLKRWGIGVAITSGLLTIIVTVGALIWGAAQIKATGEIIREQMNQMRSEVTGIRDDLQRMDDRQVQLIERIARIEGAGNP